MMNGDAGPRESLDGWHFFQDEPIEFCPSYGNVNKKNKFAIIRLM
jgi:hypothetical protein